MNTSSDGQHQHQKQILERLLLLFVGAAVGDADRAAAGAGRRRPAAPAAMPSPRLTSFEARRDRARSRCRFSRRISVWPGISSTVASVPSVPVLPVRAHEQRVLDRVHGAARRFREADADGVGAVVDDDRRGRRLALQDRAGVELHLLRREAGARRHRRIHLEDRRRAADRVLDAVQHVHHARDLLDRVADLRRPRASAAPDPGRTA